MKPFVYLHGTLSSYIAIFSPKERHDGEATPRDEELKRPVPPSEEKVSPVKKVQRGENQTAVASAPVQQQVSQTASIPPPQVPTPPPQVPTAAVASGVTPPTPAVPPAQSDHTDLLRKALDKIAELKAKLSTATPVTSTTVTPRPKQRRSPSSTQVSSATPAPTELEDDDEGSGEGEDDKSSDLVEFPNGAGTMSHDAIRMRLRRLCEVKPKTKKCHVDEKTRDQYTRGGEEREWLEIALVEALQKVGPERSQHKKLKVLWLLSVFFVTF